MAEPSHARLLNSDHELLAEGLCRLDEPAGQAMLEVERTIGAIQKQRGDLSLELDSGRSLLVSDKPMVVMITPPGVKPSPDNRRKFFRLRLIDPMAGIIEQQANSAQSGPAKGVDALAPDKSAHHTQDAPRSMDVGTAAAQGAPPSEDSTRGSTDHAQDAPRSMDVGAAAAQGAPLSEDSTRGSTKHAQDASAVGAAGKGRPAVSRMGRLFAEGRGETPAAR